MALGAHHGWTGHDETKTVTLTGTIRESSYENPHASVRLQMAGENGTTWRVILSRPGRMQNRGLDREVPRAGTEATAAGYVLRSTRDELRAERITIGGKTTELSLGRWIDCVRLTVEVIILSLLISYN